MNFPRRDFFRVSAGLLASISAFGRLVSEVSAQTPSFPVPPAARNVEAGLAAFVTKWQVAGPAILLTRFGRFLSNRTFNCHVAGSPRAYHLFLGAAGATLKPGESPIAHANLVLDEDDWKALLFGDYTGLAPLLAARAFPSRDEANRAVLLAIVFYVFAHIPASADNDPAFLARVMQDLFERQGLPGCEGEPATLEELERIENDPSGSVSDEVLGVNRAPAVTEELARWVANLGYDDLPEEQIAVAKEQLKSILGVAYAATLMGPAAPFLDAVRSFGDREEATAIGGAQSFRTSARTAAMTNSFLAQLLEWEDWTFLTHSGAAIVPVVLAAGELAGSSGKEILTAIVAGNEILARAGEFLTDVIHTGNAQAVHQLELPFLAGKLLGLDEAGLRDASGIACTQPQVTSIPAWTAGAKGLLTGSPAHTAILAAQLAERGLSGRRDLLENPLGYFYRVADVASPRALEKAVAGLGAEWRFAGEYFNKRYPTDGFQLPAVHAVLDVHRQMVEAGLSPRAFPATVERIFVRIPLVMAATATMFNQGRSDLLDRVLDPERPDWTYIALLFDGPYPMASALRDGELTHRQYGNDRIGDAGIRALYEKVELVPDLSMGVFGADATVTTTDGREFRKFVACIREDVNAGYDGDEKFRITAGDVLSSERIRTILEAIDRLEEIGDIRRFTNLL